MVERGILRRIRGWECAVVLLGEFRERLTCRQGRECQRAFKAGPELLDSRKAKKLQAMFDALMEDRI